MMMNPPTVPRTYVNAPTYDDLVNTLELIRHATAEKPDDGGHHEAAHDLADSMLKRVEARKQYEGKRHACDLPGCVACGNPERSGFDTLPDDYETGDY